MMNSDELPVSETNDTPSETSSTPITPPAPSANSAATAAIANDDVTSHDVTSEPTVNAGGAEPESTVDQATVQANFMAWFETNIKTLEQRRDDLIQEIKQLEKRQARIQKEMQTTFAGSSEEIAVRVQSFKEYLLGSLQDLVVAADRLELVKQVEVPAEAPVETAAPETTSKSKSGTFAVSDLTFAEPSYQQKNDRIRKVIEIFQTEPDYYGPPWKLRRTFDKIPAERTAEWFFTQGGRGAVKTLGSRLQNILVGSAVISILYNLYGDQLRPLILANSPERLGEWRRGLQDCLGLTRNEFSADRGPALFEFPEPLIQRAERTQQDGRLPLIIVDEMEEAVNLGVLQFPLWLAFAPAIDEYANRQTNLYDQQVAYQTNYQRSYSANAPRPSSPGYPRPNQPPYPRSNPGDYPRSNPYQRY